MKRIHFRPFLSPPLFFVSHQNKVRLFGLHSTYYETFGAPGLGVNEAPLAPLDSLSESRFFIIPIETESANTFLESESPPPE